MYIFYIACAKPVHHSITWRIYNPAMYTGCRIHELVSIAGLKYPSALKSTESKGPICYDPTPRQDTALGDGGDGGLCTSPGYNSIKYHINPVNRTGRSPMKIAIARQRRVAECVRVFDNVIKRFGVCRVQDFWD